MTRQLIEQISLILPQPPSTDALSRLDRYLTSLETWNPKLNLVSRAGTSLAAELESHVLDSVRALPVLTERIAASVTRPDTTPGATSDPVPGGETAPEGVRLLDVGSGGGFPGLVIAALMPEWQLTLVERSERKCGFLRNMALEMPNVRVHEGDPDSLPEGHRAGFAVMRAVCSLDHPLVRETLMQLEAPAVLFMYKGRRERIDEELAAMAGGAGAERPSADIDAEVVGPLQPGSDTERHIVQLRLRV